VSEASVLVTGATGFLGRQLLRALSDEKLARVALVRDAQAWEDQPWRSELGPVTTVVGSPIAPRAWLERAAALGVRCIFHTAGLVRHTRESPDEMLTLNVQGTLNMVRAARELGARLVFVSSSGTVGCFRSPHDAADEAAPFAERLVARWPYYASKIRAEREAARLSDELGVELVIVRPPVLLGPDDHRHRATSYVHKVMLRKVPAVPPGGMHFTDVRDVAAALARLATLSSPKRAYHLPGTACSLRQFFEMVSDIAGSAAIRRPMPRWAALSLAKFGGIGLGRPAWLPDPVVLEMSTCYWGLRSEHASDLSYAPRLPEKTLRDTVSWLSSAHGAKGAVS
jgi:dihydroflavonol-4-reductase